MDFSYLEERGIDVKAGIGFCADENRYLSMLQRFYKMYDKNRRKLLVPSEDGNNDGFTIAVHALKGNSRMIGANSFADLAEEFEEMGKSGKIDEITARLPELMDSYMVLMEIIKPYGEMEPVHIPGEMSEFEACEIGERLLQALDDYDGDLASKLLKELMKYPFRITLKRRLKEAGENIEGYMFEEAYATIRNALDSIYE